MSSGDLIEALPHEQLGYPGLGYVSDSAWAFAACQIWSFSSGVRVAFKIYVTPCEVIGLGESQGFFSVSGRIFQIYFQKMILTFLLSGLCLTMKMARGLGWGPLVLPPLSGESCTDPVGTDPVAEGKERGGGVGEMG